MYIHKTYSVDGYTVLKFYCNIINLYSRRSGIFKFLGEHGQGKNTIVSKRCNTTDLYANQLIGYPKATTYLWC